MRKLILTIVLILSLSSSAFAVLPAIGIGLGALIAGAIHLSGIYYYYHTNQPFNVSGDGSGLSHSSTVTWIDLTKTSLPVPTLVEKPLHAHMDTASIRALVESKPGEYPGLKVALQNHSPLDPSDPNSQQSQIYSPDGATFYQQEGGTHFTGKFYGQAPGGVFWHWNDYYQRVACNFYVGGTETINGVDYDIFNVYTVIMAANTVDPPPASDQSFRNNLTQNSSSTVDLPAVSTYQAELDKMLADPDYTPTFTDDTTGLPYVPPVSIPTHQQLVAADNAVAAQQAAAAAAGSAHAATQAAQQAAAAAAAHAAANPGDSGAQAAAATAAANAAAQQAYEDAVKSGQAQQGADDADAAAVANPGAPANAYGDGAKFEFGQRFNEFISDMKTSGFFSLPSRILGTVPSGGESVFHLDFGRFGFFDFDLACYGSAINTIRVLVFAVFSVACLRIITLGGS